MDSILLVLMTPSGKLFTRRIPSEAEGKYIFSDPEGIEKLDFLSIHAFIGQWNLYVSVGAKIDTIDNNRLHSIQLMSKELHRIQFAGENYSLYMESENMESRVFHNYFLKREGDFTIGNSASCDIYYPSPLVGKVSAVLSYRNQRWSIKNQEREVELFVNGLRREEALLSAGDTIFLMGLKLLVGMDFLSLNDGNLRVILNPASFTDSPPLSVVGNADCETATDNRLRKDQTEYFSRRPRRKYPIEKKEIVIEDPPMSISGGSIPMMLRMGGSMVMGGSSVLHGNYASVLSMVLFPILTQKYTEKQRNEYEKKRIYRYRKYLSSKKMEIRQEKELEEKILNQNYPCTSEILSYPYTGKRLFERRNIENDFLSVRLGSGEIPLLAEYRYNQERFNLDDDPLEAEMHQLTDKKAILTNVPILLDLKEYSVCSVSGHPVERMKLLRNLLLQLSILNSYDEVKMIFLLDRKDLDELPEIRYLPHVWDDEKEFRYIATDSSEAYLIGEKLSKDLEESMAHPNQLKSILKDRPYYVVFALSKKIYDSMEILKKVFKLDQNIGMSVITFFSQMPKEAEALIRLRADAEPKLILLKEGQMNASNFCLDSYDQQMAANALKKVSNTVLNVKEAEYTLPKMLTFLEMYGVGMTEHLNPYKRWLENNPVNSLAAPVGITDDGSLFMLDLHEKYQGPHGLIAGSTGSGKSEFIITYILSMAVNYHPDEVQFLLIDYKGGGLAGAFVNPLKGIRLPHVAGTITNLDGAAISRSLSSIQAELNRRQRLLNKAARETNEGTMDIYKYQKLYRKGILKEPIPHLFIIADEFAELKGQQSAFMDQLISASRIGRSLGIHLILATQKPSGVVSEQISANSKFRVCLKVQTKSDSEEMLRRPDAAELKDTGRFYLSVGYNEFYALGQSAWCGAPYEPQDAVINNKDESVQIIDNTGNKLVEIKPHRNTHTTGLSQIVSTVQYLSDLAVKMKIRPKQLWLDPLSEEISLQKLMEKHSCSKESLTAVLGMVDDPEKQTQFPLTFDLRKTKHVLVAGESRGGKTTFLESMLYSLCSSYSPEDFWFYGIDLSGGALKIFDCLPHCGGIFTENNEKEIDRFFQLLQKIVEERKKLFAETEVNSYEAYRQLGSLPKILVLIDQAANLKNWASGNEHYMNLAQYMKETTAYGITFVLSANRINDLLVKVQHEISHGFGIMAKDRFDYQDIIGAKTMIQPQDNPGRGIFKEEDRTLEFQTARFSCPGTEASRKQLLKAELDKLSKVYNVYKKAERIVSFSREQTYEEFISNVPEGRFPIGFHLADMRKISMPLKQLFCTSVYMGNPDAKKTILNCFLQAYARNTMELWIIKASDNSVFDLSDVQEKMKDYPAKIRLFESSKEDSISLWKELSIEVKKRTAVRNAAFDMLKIQPEDTKAMAKCYPYMKEHTKPLMVLFERYLDYCAEGDETCNHIMPKIYQEGKGYNIYFTAVFQEDDDYRIGTDPTFRAFNRDRFTLLYGGCFDRQGLVQLPSEYRNITEPANQYGSLLMQYQDQVYPLFMPCGVQNIKEEDPDDLPII